MRVAIWSDHAGLEMKEALRFNLGVLQHDVRIIGLLSLRISSWSTSN
jgi:ribose 5-phosphate isomerase RpiB